MPSPQEKRTVLLLAMAQALFQTSAVIVVSLSGLVGLRLAEDKGLATLPVAMMMVAAAALMIPASLLMQRYGRRAGFLVGATLGCFAGVTAAAALHWHSFWLFVLSSMLVGGYQSFAQYYRFAAADAASLLFKSRAIAWVTAGGVVAALVGGSIVRQAQKVNYDPFIFAYVAMVALGLVALLVISRLQLALPASADSDSGAARPLGAIVRQPAFITALTGSAAGYGVMMLVMTATPLAMLQCGQPDSATVIQWHVLGMFVPSFFTGHLIVRYGVLSVMQAGILLLAAHVAIALSGDAYLHFLSGLILLGAGWNFLFIGGTALLTETYRPAERSRTQATHDFLVFGTSSAASFAAGSLMQHVGWEVVNWVALPILAAAMLAVWWLTWLRRKERAES
ncbi:MAG TPA: MFS transporter [Dongiaceae bacterium]|nr:MFS transporter [Dongiaceae bacterium]